MAINYLLLNGIGSSMLVLYVDIPGGINEVRIEA